MSYITVAWLQVTVLSAPHHHWPSHGPWHAALHQLVADGKIPLLTAVHTFSATEMCFNKPLNSNGGSHDISMIPRFCTLSIMSQYNEVMYKH
jgi:hypothetical protein